MLISPLLILICFEDWIPNTGIYKLASDRQVIATHDNHIYALDMFEAKVYHFDEKGKKVQSFGSRGAGPGEFRFPTRLDLVGEQLFIKDGLYLTRLDLEGRLIDKQKLPFHGNIEYEVTPSGVFYFKSEHQRSSDSEIRKLFWSPFDFNKKTEIIDWELGPFDKSKSRISRVIKEYYVSGKVSRMYSNSLGSLVFLRIKDEQAILCVDTKEKTVVRSIDLSEYQATGFRVTPFDNLSIFYPLKRKRRGITFLDPMGEKVASPLKGVEAFGAFFHNNGWLYYWLYDTKDDIQKVTRYPLAEIKRHKPGMSSWVFE